MLPIYMQCAKLCCDNKQNLTLSKSFSVFITYSNSLIYRSAMFCIFCASHKKNQWFSHLSWIWVHLETQIQTFLLFRSLIIPNIRHTRYVMFIAVIDWSYSNSDFHGKYVKQLRECCLSLTGNIALVFRV